MELVQGQVSDENRVKTYTLRFQLDTLVESYKVHIKQMIALLNTKRVKQPFQEDISQQLAEIKQRQLKISEEINDIKTVQKPTLDKIERYLEDFQKNLSTKSNINIHRLKKDGLGQMLIFEEKEIESMFVDTKFKGYIDNILKNGKFLEKMNDGRYFYQLNRSALHDIDPQTTAVEYDRLFDASLVGIENLLSEGEEIKLRWNTNAEKVLAIKEMLRSFDEPIEL